MKNEKKRDIVELLCDHTFPPRGAGSTALRLSAADEIERLRAALELIAAHDSGMKPDFSNAAKQAAIAREALSRSSE